MKKIKTLNNAECQKFMAEWIACEGTKSPKLDEAYNVIRKDLTALFAKTLESQKQSKDRKDYFVDVDYGIRLYEYLEQQSWFNLRVASDVGFWRYLSIMVIPEVVEERWGYDNEDHYWRKPTRIWLRSIWWYVYISMNHDLKETKLMLLMDKFSTDTILNLIERSGRDGININVYKSIIKVYSLVKKEVIEDFKKKSKKGDDLFRAVMRLNTARSVVIEPDFYNGGTLGYVFSLFESFGIKKIQMVEYKK